MSKASVAGNFSFAIFVDARIRYETRLFVHAPHARYAPRAVRRCVRLVSVDGRRNHAERGQSRPQKIFLDFVANLPPSDRSRTGIDRIDRSADSDASCRTTIEILVWVEESRPKRSHGHRFGVANVRNPTSRLALHRA
jgi:hypothetical protein